MSRLNKEMPADFIPDDKVSEQFKQRFNEGKMPCASAFSTAEEWGIPTRTLGLYADFHKFQITRCQIGLFGYGKGVKLVKKLDALDPEIEKAVRSRTQDNIMTCDDVFAIAKEMKVSKVDVGSVCQTLDIKIKKCRFGAF